MTADFAYMPGAPMPSPRPMVPDPTGADFPHQPWCTEHRREGGLASGCERSVAVDGLLIKITQLAGTLRLTVQSDGQTPLTAAQVRRLAAELVDASRILQGADHP